MKKVQIILLAAFAATVAFGAAPQPVKVKAAKKTADSHRNTATVGRKAVERSSTDKFYEFELSTMSPAVPTNVTVKWVVVTLNMLGNPRLGTSGEQQIALPKNQPVAIETDDFALEGKEVQVIRRHASHNTDAEEKIVGYGVRVFDDKGTLLSETISPDNSSKVVQEAFDGKLGNALTNTERKEKRQKRD